ncbi:MAG: HAMP domain-containing sensor histidine kinase [Rhodospirillales bacterium]
MKHLLAPIIALGVGVFAALIFVGVLVFNATLERIVIEQAERTSTAWAGYIGNRMSRIEDIAKGAPLNDEEQRFLDGVRGFGDIFRFKLFDTKGRIRLISDDLHTDLANNPTAGEDNWKALSVVKSGEPYSELEDGRLKPDRPDVYAETYVPVWRNDRMVAVAEVYMDRTAETAALRAGFLTFGWRAAGLILLALSLPAGLAAWAVLQLRRQNHVLNIERNRAREAERAKGRFLAHMSHEFRTPLNSIQGLTQVLLRGDLGPLENPKHREYVQDIYDSGDHLLSLVNDVLDLSKIDFGKYELTESDFDIGKCVHAALQVVKGWEAANALSLEVRGLETGLFVHADRRAIYQSALNLLSNAVKFTQPGGRIDLSVALNDAGECTITVTDTGIGIAAHDLARIFEPFSQRGNHEYVASRRGTGLGLTLVKSLIDLHGGRVSLESAVGVGTTVCIHLPQTRVVNPSSRGEA